MGSLEVVLDRAAAIARSDDELPEEWLHRVRRIEQSPSKTYVAALGAALLAKASDPRVNTLARTAKAGPTGYSLRGVAEFMAAQADRYGYHMGVTGQWPLNNSPFYRNADRIDRFTSLRSDVRTFHEDFVRYLQDLAKLTAEDALLALAAFLRLRIEHASELRSQIAAVAEVHAGSYREVVDLATLFCTEDPEGGKRGQALTAALLDCVYDEVDLVGINNPRPLDVRVRCGARIALGVEVKQQPVGEKTGLQLAASARSLDCDKALLVAIGQGQPPIDRDGLRTHALVRYGVLTEVVETVPELFATVTLHTLQTAAGIARRFPAAYAKRMQEYDLSRRAQERWVSLVSALAAPGNQAESPR